MEANEEANVPQSKRRKLIPGDDPGFVEQKATSSALAAATNNPREPTYSNEYLRLNKDNLYMIIALRMEDFVYKDDDNKDDDNKGDDKKVDKKVSKPYRKVGAVLVLPNDIVWAVDRTRNGVHAAARLLIKHADKAKGSKIFMSRKPCSMCAKLLVQSKVERVLYLPFEPEYYRTINPESENDTEKDRKIRERDIQNNEAEMKQVDALFTASPIGQTKFVLQVHKTILANVMVKETPQTPKEDKNKIQEMKEKLVGKKYGTDWMRNVESVRNELPWPAYDDKMAEKVKNDFENAMELVARYIVMSGRGADFEFEPYPEGSNPTEKDEREEEKEGSNPTEKHEREEEKEGFNPTVKDSVDEKQAHSLITMAKILAQRTDDPKKGVGAVIVTPEMEFISLGWNGFPLKALYGEFPRGSSGERKENPDLLEKHPYIIHAEQNALLMRNTKNIEGSILFVTKTPCQQCSPMIKMAGIKTVVVDPDESDLKKALEKTSLQYDVFPKMVAEKKFICYQTKYKAPDLKDIPATEGKKKVLKV